MFAFPKIVLCPECGREIVPAALKRDGPGQLHSRPSASAAPGASQIRVSRALESAARAPGLLKLRPVLWSSEPPCCFRSFSSWLSRRNHFLDPVCADLQSEMQPGTSRCRSRSCGSWGGDRNAPALLGALLLCCSELSNFLL